jgi:hypothetical protein
MDMLINGIMKGLNYMNLGDYLRNQIYRPEDLEKEFKLKKRRIDERIKLTESQIQNRIEMLKELENLVEFDDIKHRETLLLNK